MASRSFALISSRFMRGAVRVIPVFGLLASRGYGCDCKKPKKSTFHVQIIG